MESPKIPLGVMDNTVIDFTVSQLVFSGQYFVALKTAKIVRQLSERSLARTEDQDKRSMLLFPITSYWCFRKISGLLNENKKSLDQMYEETAGMNKQGLNEETDVDQVNINRSNVQALITSMESQLEIALKQFKYLLGVDFDNRWN